MQHQLANQTTTPAPQPQAQGGDKFDSLKACAKRLFVQKNKDLTDVTAHSVQVQQLESTQHDTQLLLSKGAQKVASLEAELESTQLTAHVQTQLIDDVQSVCEALGLVSDKIHRAKVITNTVTQAALGTMGQDTGNSLRDLVRSAQEVTESAHGKCMPDPQGSNLVEELSEVLALLKAAKAAGEGEVDIPELQSYAALLHPQNRSRLHALTQLIQLQHQAGRGQSALTQSYQPSIVAGVEHMTALLEAVNNNTSTGRGSGTTSSNHPHLPNFAMQPTPQELDLALEYNAWVQGRAVEWGLVTQEVANAEVSALRSLSEKSIHLLLEQQSVTAASESNRAFAQSAEEETAQAQQQIRANEAVILSKKEEISSILDKEKELLQRLQELRAKEEKEDQATANTKAALAQMLDTNRQHGEDATAKAAALNQLFEEGAYLDEQTRNLQVLDAGLDSQEKQHELLAKEVDFGRGKVATLRPALEGTKRLEETQEKEFGSLSSALKNLDTIEESNLAAYLPLATTLIGGQGASSPSSAAPSKKGGKKKKGGAAAKKKGVTFSQEETDQVFSQQLQQEQQDLVGLQVAAVMDLIRRHGDDIKLCLQQRQEREGGQGDDQPLWAVLEELVAASECDSNVDHQSLVSGGPGSAAADASLRRLQRDVELQLSCRTNEVSSTVSKIEHLVAECVQRQEKLLGSNKM